MQVSAVSRVFNKQYSATMDNGSIFSNALNDTISIDSANDIKKRRLEQKIVVAEYHNIVKQPKAAYIEINSAAFVSMKESMQNQVKPIDIKRVNAVLAYSA